MTTRPGLLSRFAQLFRSPLKAAPAPAREREPGSAGSSATVEIEPPRPDGLTITYSPQVDGGPDTGEIVWTWVAYEEDPGRGKDRPVLVVGRDGSTLLGLMLSSNRERDDDRNWLALGSGSWDPDNRPSWVRLDRVLDVPEAGIRREGAIVDPALFARVTDALAELRGR